MSLSNNLFNKDLYELKALDLEEFFSIEQVETSILEFKSGEVELEKIHREVCAFLNTEGGLLIIGAPRENKGKCIGALTPTNKFKSVDSIIQSISTGISPSPIGIKGHSITLSLGLVHVIEVTQSQTPPHQVNKEGTYYIRLEREAKPAPHGVVEALFNRRHKPVIDFRVDCGWLKKDNTTLLLAVDYYNNSDVTAEFMNYHLELTGKVNLKKSSNNGVEKLENKLVLKSPQGVNTPLVKGLTMSIELELNSYSRYLLVYSYCWCRDAQLVRKMAVYDAKEAGFVKYHNSLLESNEYSMEDIQKYYEEVKDIQLERQS